ncbi:hypothetical protein [Sinorhizobium prairiense]|uniref:hypothetical protein n=1 Tax=unclassified Sinorhizobium TaxID=2613772 RepID=UPI0023D84168|nr:MULTISPECIES: hypothetical protein [unclassified Sinorhizobium]WEJ08449.1 hypothetical protein N0Q90_01790 [Sinorhizobium sp. M103]WEJ14046.1 hypothetical protein N0Q91_00920 [Sinorhizobium sp. K101]WEJ35647.1 hypothetical protein N0R80_00920 [Sinorhizobium sp. C101]
MPVSSTFMFVSPLDPERRQSLSALLATLTCLPGFADPDNVEIPFARLPGLHFARFVILDDNAAADNAVYDVEIPAKLAFLGDIDGTRDAFVKDLVRIAGPGLSKIFAHCLDFNAAVPLEAWLIAHNVEPAVNYSNWPGRSVQQVQEEAALREALLRYLPQEQQQAASPSDLHRRLRSRVKRDGPYTASLPTTPLGESLREMLHFVASAILLLALVPLLLIVAPFYLVFLRRKENSDASATARPSAQHLRTLFVREDLDVTNQFSAFGTVKPGRFRLWTLIAVFWIVGFATRHLYTRGRLARVGSIHFARWVFLDDHRRLLFGSNYDGSLEAYMDDFVNKVAFGLNLVFSNGIGYPRTRFLVLDGAKDEQTFKHYIRRHQLPTEVWYKAYPGLTTADIARNARVRLGLEAETMSNALARQWLAEL